MASFWLRLCLDDCCVCNTSYMIVFRWKVICDQLGLFVIQAMCVPTFYMCSWNSTTTAFSVQQPITKITIFGPEFILLTPGLEE